MKKLIKDFVKIKTFLKDSVDDKLDFFLTDSWDPISRHILIQELYKTLANELHNTFPNFPEEYLPKIRFKVIEEENIIEKHIQSFFNDDKRLIFLANLDIGSTNYDLYYRKSYDISVPFIFFAKYGHKNDSLIKGAKTAAAEFLMGKCTPLSVAYQIAQEEGIL
ncbi:MAG: hypothetical protein ACFFG0_03790 [Candidatus Thorarchaeota archaeon]